MEKLKIKIHPTFIIFACLLIYFGYGFLFFNYFIVILVHEFSHAFVASKLGYQINNIKLIPFGICLNLESCNLKPNDEIKIAIAGPLSNLILFILCLSLYWIWPACYNILNLFCFANLVTCLFNLLPAFPLDGGRIVLGLLKTKFSLKKSIVICKIISIVLSVALIIIFIISCFVEMNLTYLFVSICIITGITDKNISLKYSLIHYNLLKKNASILKEKSIVIFDDMPIQNVVRFIDRFSYLKVTVINKDKEVVNIFYEDEILNLLYEKA